MNGKTLKIGMIAYANLFPIFCMLQRQIHSSNYEFVEGVPSDLNKKIRMGTIDISPSSSIEYLRNAERYSLIENHSISAKGPVRSILLFSKVPIKQLHGNVVLTSSQSETSVALLQIIFEKFFFIKCPLETSSEELEKGFQERSAYLLIGDQALREGANRKKFHIYDLGEIWYEQTGLPMTFALWIVTKACGTDSPDLLEGFKRDLDRSKKSALGRLQEIAAASPLRGFLKERELVDYWEGMSYDFGEEHKKGLELFKKYAEDLGIIKSGQFSVLSRENP